MDRPAICGKMDTQKQLNVPLHAARALALGDLHAGVAARPAVAPGVQQLHRELALHEGAGRGFRGTDQRILSLFKKRPKDGIWCGKASNSAPREGALPDYIFSDKTSL